jgi:hypothetical protein
MDIVSQPIEAMIQEIPHCLQVGGFWTSRLDEFLAQRDEPISPIGINVR